MGKLGLVVIVALIGACKDKSKSAPVPVPEPGTGSAPAGSGSAAPAGSSAGSSAGSAAAAPSPGCEDWRIVMSEELGMGSVDTTVECTKDEISITRTTFSPRDDDAEPETATLARDKWDALWRALEAAGWRELPETCPELDPRPDSAGITALALDIRAGATTKRAECHGMDLTPRHQHIQQAIEAAFSARTEP